MSRRRIEFYAVVFWPQSADNPELCNEKNESNLTLIRLYEVKLSITTC